MTDRYYDDESRMERDGMEEDALMAYWRRYYEEEPELDPRVVEEDDAMAEEVEKELSGGIKREDPDRKIGVEVPPFYVRQYLARLPKSPLTALKSKNMQDFKSLLSPTNVNHFYEYPNYGTILYVAAFKGFAEYAELSIEQGADVNGYNDFRKDTPLHAACKGGHIEVVKLLLNKEASISKRDRTGRTPLHVAALITKKENREECLKALLDSEDMKKYIDTKDRSGSTALHLALVKNYTDAAMLLLDYGANPYISSDRGKSVKELIQEQLPQVIDKLRQPDYFKENIEDTVKDLLFRSLYNKDLTRFKELLKDAANQRIDIGNIDDGKNTLLQFACENVGLEEFVEILLDNNVDPNAKCSGERWEPILLAAFQGNYKALEKLVNNPKTNLNAVDESGKENAYHKIAKMENESLTEEKYIKCAQILNKIKEKSNTSLNFETGMADSGHKPALRRANVTDLPKLNAENIFKNTPSHYADRNLKRGNKEAKELMKLLQGY